VANGRWVLVEMNAGAETAAFQTLRQMHSRMRPEPTITNKSIQTPYPRWASLPTHRSITGSNIFRGVVQPERLSATSSKPLRRGATAIFTGALRLRMMAESSGHWSREQPLSPTFKRLVRKRDVLLRVPTCPGTALCHSACPNAFPQRTAGDDLRITFRKILYFWNPSFLSPISNFGTISRITLVWQVLWQS